MNARLHAFLLLAGLAVAGCNTHESATSRTDAGLSPAISNNLVALMEIDDPSAFRAAAAERGFVTAETGVVLDVQTVDLADSDRAALDRPGVHVRTFHPQYERISAVARDPAAVRAIAELPFVRVVAPSYGATTNTGGSAY